MRRLDWRVMTNTPTGTPHSHMLPFIPAVFPSQGIKMMFFYPALTGTGGHTAGTKGVATLRVGHGLEGVCVVGDEGWAVQFTDATMVEVEAGLVETGRWWSPGCCNLVRQCSRAVPGKMPTPCVLEDWPKGHIPGSQNAWGPCSLQHTAHGSSQWAAGPCIGHSHWCRWCQSLLMRGQDGCWVGPGQQTLSSIALPSRRQLIPNKSPHHFQLSTCSSPTSRCQVSLRLTDLTVLRALTPAVIIITGWGAGWA